MLTAVSALAYVASAWTVLLILRQRKEPISMLAWTLTCLFLPGFGPLLYYLLGEPRIRRRARKRRRKAQIVRALAESIAGQDAAEAQAGLPPLDPALRELVGIAAMLGDLPVTAGNKVRVFTEPKAIYDDMLEAIDSARNHVHLEYYIFRSDETGKQFRDHLAARAREGVEVRLLVDGIGTWGTGRAFFRPLIQAGGKVETFLPAVPLRRKWNINYRNHRKLLLVDGTIAYTGSQNIGDEYRGRWRRVAPWKDTHLRIEGPAVTQLQEIFLADWYFAAEENLVGSRYLPRQEQLGTSLLQIVPSGPDQQADVLHEFVFLAVTQAQRTVRISTPYFVPDPGLLLALKSTARRGIRVEVLIPTRTDSRLVLWAGRSYYRELLEAGVRVFEHPSSMLHSKVVTIDDQWSLVSSANMDVRSFRLNFEVTTSIFDPAISRELNLAFEEDCRQADPVQLNDLEQETLARSILEGLARLCSPLL